MRLYKIAWVFIFTFGLLRIVPAQKHGADSTTILLGIQGHYGSILAHARDVIDISNSNPWGFTAEVSRIRHTQASWDACNCISQNGISVSYFNYNNPDVLGSSLNLAVFGEPILLQGRVALSLRGAAGFSYLTRTHHPENNPQNIFFSQPLNGLLLVQLNTRLSLSDEWQLRTGVSYNHISNGGMRQPNKGMNFPVLNLGIDYHVNPLPFQKRPKSRSTNSTMHYYTGVFMNSRKSAHDASRQRKPVIGVQAGFFKPFTHTNAAGLAVEGSYDGALKELNTVSHELIDHRIVSGLVRHHFLFGRFDFSQALGLYLYNRQPDSPDVFQRYALEYKLTDRIKAGFSLKAHLQVAEQMDLRMMVVF